MINNIMKFLLPTAGLVCYIAGLYVYFTENAEQEKKGKLLMLAGFFLIIANMFCFWYSVNNKMDKDGFMSLIIPVAVFIITFITIFFENNELKVASGSFIIIAIILIITYGIAKLPSVTLNDDVIEMGGKYGGSFEISAIQSVDTVSVFSRIIRRKSGNNSPVIHYGNFDMQNEKQQVKLRILFNNPPYIKIRMNDNSLFLFNFKEPDETVEFYNKIKDVINGTYQMQNVTLEKQNVR